MGEIVNKGTFFFANNKGTFGNKKKKRLWWQAERTANHGRNQCRSLSSLQIIGLVLFLTLSMGNLGGRCPRQAEPCPALVIRQPFTVRPCIPACAGGCRVAVTAGRGGNPPQGLFSCIQNSKTLQDSPSHRIFQRMHEVINLHEIKN